MLPRANLAICHVESDPRFFAPLRSESVVISTKVTARFCASSTIPKSSSHASMVKRWHSLTMKTLKQGLLEQKKYFLGAFSLIICSPSTSAGHISFGNTLGISSTASFPDVIHSSALQQRSSPQMSCLCHWVHRTGFTYSGLPPWNTPPLCIRSPPFPQAAPTGKKIGAVAPK